VRFLLRRAHNEHDERPDQEVHTFLTRGANICKGSLYPVLAGLDLTTTSVFSTATKGVVCSFTRPCRRTSARRDRSPPRRPPQCVAIILSSTTIEHDQTSWHTSSELPTRLVNIVSGSCHNPSHDQLAQSVYRIAKRRTIVWRPWIPERLHKPREHPSMVVFPRIPLLPGTLQQFCCGFNALSPSGILLSCLHSFEKGNHFSRQAIPHSQSSSLCSFPWSVPNSGIRK